MNLTIIFFLLFFSIQSIAKVILIDPGHGGEESGAKGYLVGSKGKKGRILYEKDLSLRLAVKLKDKLSKHTTAYLTRSLDRPVTLQERAEMADLVKADLFLSIHFNSSTNKKSRGFELYYLDNNTDVAVQKVAKTENLNLQGEELIVNQILLDLVVQQTVTHSKELASKVHEKVKPIIKSNKIEDRGVKPGLFYVLALSKRPGLLIETGFISNPDELQKINEEKFLNEMARAIANGVIEYINIKK